MGFELVDLLFMRDFTVALNSFFTIVKHTEHHLQQIPDFLTLQAKLIQVLLISELVEVLSLQIKYLHMHLQRALLKLGRQVRAFLKYLEVPVFDDLDHFIMVFSI